jgi:hypothetical protein
MLNLFAEVLLLATRMQATPGAWAPHVAVTGGR